MNQDSFSVTCGSCGRSAIATSVSEFHNVGGFRGYSYSTTCECGVRTEVDGSDGEHIPQLLKTQAALHRNGRLVFRAIDNDRRSLPNTKEKRFLRSTRLDRLEMIDRNNWIVYRFNDDQWIEYSIETGVYVLNSGAGRQECTDVECLIELIGQTEGTPQEGAG